ncbi:hypothetical protein Esti_000173 [Eimeria stiedai]
MPRPLGIDVLNRASFPCRRAAVSSAARSSFKTHFTPSVYLGSKQIRPPVVSLRLLLHEGLQQRAETAAVHVGPTCAHADASEPRPAWGSCWGFSLVRCFHRSRKSLGRLNSAVVASSSPHALPDALRVSGTTGSAADEGKRARRSFCSVRAAGSSGSSSAPSQQKPSIVRCPGKGFTALRTSARWGPRTFDFFVCGLDPDGILEGERSALSAVHAVKTLQPDVVLLGLGYLDREKINETFSREALLHTRELEPLDQVSNRDNGQFIPIIQHLMIHGLPLYTVGRDRLVEMGALGQQLLWRPLEFYSLAWKLVRSKKEKEPITPCLRQVLSEDSSEYCLLKIHQYLLEWTESQLSAPEPAYDFDETKFAEKWLVGRNKRECQLRVRARQFEMARLPLPANLKSKPTWRFLIVCDAALEERLAERLSGQLTRLKSQSPHFDRMFQLENTSSTRFHLCLMIYIILPIATLCRILWKLAKKTYLEYWVKGSTVSVTGDEILARLTGQADADVSESDKRKDKLEIVESRWLGLKHSVRDKSRD